MLFLILGIIGMTQEYRHRTATPTFLTTPTRWRVVVAKLIAYALAAVPFALVVLAVNVLVVTIYAGARGDAPSLSGDNLEVLGQLRAGAGDLRGDRRRASAPCCATRSAPSSASLVYLFVVETVIRLIPATSGAYKWMPGGPLEALTADRSRVPTSSSPGRAACCCSVTVWSPPSSARVLAVRRDVV